MATPWFSVVPTKFEADVPGQTWEPPAESRTGAPGYAEASAAAAGTAAAPPVADQVSIQTAAPEYIAPPGFSVDEPSRRRSSIVLKEAVAAASDAGSERSVHSSVHSSANSTGTAAASGTEPITNADTAAAAAAAARLAELEAELAATQAEKESLTAKVSELEANSDKFQTEAHVLRKELRAVKKAKGMSMHDIVAYLPSSRQQFHQMLLASQKNDVPVIMEDVRHIMDGGGVPQKHSRKSHKNKVATLRRRTTRNQIVPAGWLEKQNRTGSPLSDEEEDREITAHEAHLQLAEMRRRPITIKQKTERVRMLLDILAEKQHVAKKPLQESFSMFTFWQKRVTGRLFFSLTNLPFWTTDIKLVAGKHGQHVGVYFTFVKWTLLINVLAAILMSAFFVVPYQLMYGFGAAEAAVSDNSTISYSDGDIVAGLFTGGAALNASAYFLGSYVTPFSAVSLANSKGSDFVPETATDSNMDTWNIPLAFLLSIIVYFTIVLVCVLAGVYRAVKDSVLFRSDRTKSGLDLIAFEFDYSMTNVKSLEITRLARCQRLRERLQEDHLLLKFLQLRPKYLRWRRVGLNFFVLAVLGTSFYAIFVVASLFLDKDDGTSLIPALVIAILFSGVPMVFKKVARLECYRSPLTVIQVTIARVCILRFVGLYVFLYSIWIQIERYHCWETFVGQRIYTQYVVGSIAFELFLNLTKDKFSAYLYRSAPNSCLAFMLLGGEPPQFQVVERALTLSYDQALVWVGTYFCPLLPLLGILRSVIMFYAEKRSTMKHTQPGSTVIASKVGLTWLIWGLMFATLILVALPMCYMLYRVPPSGVYMTPEWTDRFLDTLTSTAACGVSDPVVADCRVCLSPRDTTDTTSTVCWQGARFSQFNSGGGVQVTMTDFCNACPRGCGPFRSLNSPFEVFNQEERTWPKWISTAFDLMGTPFFTVVLIVAFLSLHAVSQAKSRGRLKWGLRQERLRDSEFWDKKWILDVLAKKFGTNAQQSEKPV